MLSFAGVPLLLETEEHIEFVSNFHNYQKNYETDNYGYATGIKAAAIPQLPIDGRISIGILRWPSGASRCGIFHGIIDGSRLDDIRTAVGSSTQYGDLVMSDGIDGHEITVSMRMLPPKTIHNTGSGDESKNLYLITLVDIRYDWRLKSGSIELQPETWSGLYSDIADLLDTTITVETVPSDYGVPSDRWIQYYRPLTTTLDAAAMAVGQIVVTALDGTTRTVGYETATIEATAQWDEIQVSIGGAVPYEDICRAVPAAVNVVFGKVIDGVPVDPPYAKEVTLASLAMSEYTGYTGITGNVKTLYADLYNDGSNDADCDAFAEQLARDWYGWQSNDDLDFTAPGIWNWEPTGAENAIEWHYLTNGRLLTRIILDPYFIQEVGNYGSEANVNSTVLPPCCPVWYTEYHHLGTMAVSVGQTLLPGALIGTVGFLDVDHGGPHSHFALGDGSDFLNTINYAVVGQSLDVGDWLPWPSTGTRAVTDPPIYYPPVFEDTTSQEQARAYIRSCFAPWLPDNGFTQHFGSTEHKGGEYYAVDVYRTDEEDMTGQEVYLAIGSGAIESTVIFAGEISPDVLNMVIVRHRPCCCNDVFKTKYVKCATVETGDIDTDYVVGASVDDVLLTLGDSILIKNQGAGAQNRIATVNTMGAPTYREDADTGEKLVGAVVRVMQGTVNSNSIWTCLNSSVSFSSTSTVWQTVWQTGFFARLVSESGGMWKWQKLTSTAGTWSDDGPESPDYTASPIEYDGVDFFATPVAGMRVWMHWGKTEWEFFPIAPTYPAIDVGCGLVYDAETDVFSVDFTDVVFDGLYWDNDLCAIGVDYGCGLTLTGTQLVVDSKTLAGGGLTTETVEACTVLAVNPGCGLALDGDEVVADFTDVVFDGLYWNSEICAIGVDYGCGLDLSGTQLIVNMADIAGDKASTALVSKANTPPVCDSIAVDLEEDSTTSEILVTSVSLTVVGGLLRLSQSKTEYINHFNEAGLHIDRTVGSTTVYNTDVDICPIVECCLAEPLVATCYESNSGGQLEEGVWQVDFTGGATGGISSQGDCTDYTYSWDFDDGSALSTSQNPTHMYEAAGEFTPVLTVTDCCGHTDTCEPGVITVTSGVDCGTHRCGVLPSILYYKITGGPLDGETGPLEYSVIDELWLGGANTDPYTVDFTTYCGYHIVMACPEYWDEETDAAAFSGGGGVCDPEEPTYFDGPSSTTLFVDVCDPFYISSTCLFQSGSVTLEVQTVPF